MFKVNNKDIRAKLLMLFWSLYDYNLKRITHLFSTVSVIDFEQFNTCWDGFHNKSVKKSFPFQGKYRFV